MFVLADDSSDEDMLPADSYEAYPGGIDFVYALPRTDRGAHPWELSLSSRPQGLEQGVLPVLKPDISNSCVGVAHGRPDSTDLHGC